MNIPRKGSHSRLRQLRVRERFKPAPEWGDERRRCDDYDVYWAIRRFQLALELDEGVAWPKRGGLYSRNGS